MNRGHHDLSEGIERCPARIFTGTSWEDALVNVVREVHAAVHLDGRKLMTIACTGVHTEELALGWLRSEGVIGTVREIESVEVGRDGMSIHIRTRPGLSGHADNGDDHPGGDGASAAAGEVPAAAVRHFPHGNKRDGGTIISSSGARSAVSGVDIRNGETGRSGSQSGTAGAATGEGRDAEGMNPLAVGRETISPARIFKLMDEMVSAAGIHNLSRGTHGAAIADGSRILVTREDIGRHNCLDMLSGYSLLHGIAGGDKVLLRTGRVSSEIVHKVWRMGIPVVLSLSVPTALAVSLASQAGITLVGAIRAPSLTVYTHAKRIR